MDLGLRRYVPSGRPCRRRFRVLRTHRHADVQEQGGRGPARQWPALQGDDGHASRKTRILGEHISKFFVVFGTLARYIG